MDNLNFRRKYDLIIFGANSPIGKCLVKEIVNVEGLQNAPKFSWAVAGSPVKKIQKVLQDTGINLLERIDIIEADVLYSSSIQAMVKQCKILVNCLEPYVKYGEVLVKACAEEGTHHLDFSKEPLFLGKMEVKYRKIAERTNAFIIGGCGLTSFLSDFGAEYLKQNFSGEINSVEAITSYSFKSRRSLPKMSNETWNTSIKTANQIKEISNLRTRLYKSGYPPTPNFWMPYWPIQFRKEVNSWVLTNPLVESDVMERSQRYRFQNEMEQNPYNPFIQTRSFVKMPSVITAWLCLLGCAILGLIAQSKYGMELLLKFPKLFSFGWVNKQSKRAEEDAKMKLTLLATGWDLADDEFMEIEPPYKTKVLEMRCENSQNELTALVSLQAVLAILNERNEMPGKGGVYSPGVAFARTTIMDKLKRGIDVEFKE